MNNPPRKRNKSTSAASSTNSTSAANSNNPDVSPQNNQDFVTIDVSAVEVPELSEEEQSDKPDGMATLTACSWSGVWKERFLRQGRRLWS